MTRGRTGRGDAEIGRQGRQGGQGGQGGQDDDSRFPIPNSRFPILNS
ncbi:MAG: hypothetical protein F6K31_04725 [Symploca sp. SIO2G7]|nr:hypothetical protein [Symploca sp. SIO2G7]